MAFTQPTTNSLGTLGKIGLGLQAFNAGVQGRGPQFLALQQQQEQQLSNERKAAAAEDIRRAKLLFDQGRIGDIASLAQQRIGLIQDFGGDPSDTMQILELATLGAQGNEEAVKTLGQELDIGMRAAIQSGFIAPEQTGATEFERLTAGMSEEDIERAQRIRLGLEPRAVGASAKTFDIGGVPHIFDPVTQEMRPVEVEGRRIGVKEVGESAAAITEAKELGKGRAQLTSKTIDKGFEALGKIRTNIANLERAVSAIDRGASSGKIQSFLPSFRAATIELENLQGRLGLDVVGAVTFGALSKGELDLALSTALPTDLTPPELRQWIINKRDAQSKLADYFRDQINFLDQGGTVPEFLRAQEQVEEQNSDASTAQQVDFIFNENNELVPNPNKGQ